MITKTATEMLKNALLKLAIALEHPNGYVLSMVPEGNGITNHSAPHIHVEKAGASWVYLPLSNEWEHDSNVPELPRKFKRRMGWYWCANKKRLTAYFRNELKPGEFNLKDLVPFQNVTR